MKHPGRVIGTLCVGLLAAFAPIPPGIQAQIRDNGPFLQTPGFQALEANSMAMSLGSLNLPAPAFNWPSPDVQGCLEGLASRVPGWWAQAGWPRERWVLLRWTGRASPRAAIAGWPVENPNIAPGQSLEQVPMSLWQDLQPWTATTAGHLTLEVLISPAGRVTRRQWSFRAEGQLWPEGGDGFEERIEDQTRIQQRTQAGQVILESRFAWLQGDWVFQEAQTRQWREGLLVQTQTWNTWGWEVKTFMRYSLRGELREIRQEYPDQAAARQMVTWNPDGSAQVWQLLTEGELFNQYDHYQRIVLQELRDGGRLLETRRYNYHDGASRLLESAVRELPDEGLVESEYYDSNGRLSRRDLEVGLKLRSRDSFLYDDAGNLVLQSQFSQGRSREWSRTWEANTLLTEEYREDNQLIRRSQYQDRDQIDEIYYHGSLVMKVWYTDRRKTRQEDYRSNVLVRTQKY